MRNLKERSPEHYQKLLSLYREKERRLRSNRARTFVPNGKSEEFIKMIGREDHPFVSMFVGANGTSKTATGVNILCNIIYGPQNGWFEFPTFQAFPYPVKKARIISDPTTIKEKIIPEIRKWFPTNEAKRIPEAPYVAQKDGKAYEVKWETNTGWTIDIMSTEQDTKEFESVDLGFVWIDEPMPQDRFNATIGRGRTGMMIVWTYTPLFTSGWIKDWMDGAINERLAAYVQAEMEDNCIECGVRGILKHENIQRMARSFPPHERQARVFGSFGHLIGRVHKTFKRNIHVIKPFTLNPRDWTTYHALDTHPRVADHGLWLSVDRKGRKIVTAELLSEGGVKDLARRVKDIEVKMNFRMEEPRIIDPSAFNKDQHADKPVESVATQLMAQGLNYVGGSKDLMAGVKRTDDALACRIKGGKFIDPPELFIFSSCPVAIKQLEEYVWSEIKGPSRDEKKPSGKPRDRNDHQPENLHRLLLHEPTFVDMAFRDGSYRVPNRDSEMNPYEE